MKSNKAEEPKSLEELLAGVRKRSKDPLKCLLFAHHVIEGAVEKSLAAGIDDPALRFDFAYHTAEITADVVQYLVSIEAALRGKPLPLNTLVGLASNAVWHWPSYHVPELKKLLNKIPDDEGG